MEVHYHPKSTHKLSLWRDYFLEFLLISLAVTMGFFAENMREHISNIRKENHYIQSLAEDINNDTAQLNNYIRFKTSVLNYCDSLQLTILDFKVNAKTNLLYMYSRELTRYMRYFPEDRTIEQLKNAGNMHLINDWDVSNAISEYYSKTKYMEEADQELNDEISKYRRYLIEFLDLTSYDRLNERGSFLENNEVNGNPTLLSYDSSRLKIIYNEIFALKAFLQSDRQYAQALLKEANNLLVLLHKKYSFLRVS